MENAINKEKLEMAIEAKIKNYKHLEAIISTDKIGQMCRAKYLELEELLLEISLGEYDAK